MVIVAKGPTTIVYCVLQAVPIICPCSVARFLAGSPADVAELASLQWLQSAYPPDVYTTVIVAWTRRSLLCSYIDVRTYLTSI